MKVLYREAANYLLLSNHESELPSTDGRFHGELLASVQDLLSVT